MADPQFRVPSETIDRRDQCAHGMKQGESPAIDLSFQLSRTWRQAGIIAMDGRLHTSVQGRRKTGAKQFPPKQHGIVVELLLAHELRREGIWKRGAAIDAKGTQTQHGPDALFTEAAVVIVRVLPTDAQPCQYLGILNQNAQLIHAGFPAIVDDLDRLSGP